ncbi:MAG: anthranilate synthase component I [Gammaproteobacteria bacterium]|nr:anthranilate synthase component I [Gammaproteobacteria bacterium]
MSTFTSYLEFQQLAEQGYQKVGLVLETLADLETPLSVYCKLTKKQSKYSFLLESVLGGERFGRYSFIGLSARECIRSTGFGAFAKTELLYNDHVQETITGDPLSYIEAYCNRWKVYIPPNLPPFCGGLVGYFGYDVSRHIEPLLIATCPPDTLGLPDIFLVHCQDLVVIDNLRGKLQLITFADTANSDSYAEGYQKLLAMHHELKHPLDIPQKPGSLPINPPEHEFLKEDYLQAVKQGLTWISEGECMQIQVGRRVKKIFYGPSLHLYRALRTINPSPYMYYYDFGSAQIIGASPEILVRKEACEQGQKVTIRPLAGTRPRGPTPEADQAIAQELLSDAKERAEHVMLIDLARNDLGRIAKIGTVKVTEAFAIERYSHVMHIVSNVEGILKPDLSNIDVLRATFPAGTLTGAPKIRAMELIDKLEPSKRGIYGGAIGYISYSGNMDVAITIRTALVKGNYVYAQAAAGVVADSVPENEWRETEQKLSAILRAIEMVEQGDLF